MHTTRIRLGYDCECSSSNVAYEYGNSMAEGDTRLHC